MKRFITFSTIVFLIDSVEIIPSLIVVENLVASFRFELIKINLTIPLIPCLYKYLNFDIFLNNYHIELMI